MRLLYNSLYGYASTWEDGGNGRLFVNRRSREDYRTNLRVPSGMPILLKPGVYH